MSTFAVIGLGTFGRQAALALADGGADVIAIDHNQVLVDAVAERVRQACCGEAVDADAMELAGAFDAEAAIIAVGDHFDVAVLVTHMLSTHGVGQIVVQVESESQAAAIRSVGATGVVFPERDSARRLAQSILEPALVDKISLGADAGIIEVSCPPSYIGKGLQDLDMRRGFGVSVIAIKRGSTRPEEVHIEINPDPTRQLKADDILVVIGRNRPLSLFREQMIRQRKTETETAQLRRSQKPPAG
jgi:trk system potassium uptake protein TrkA